MNPPAVPDPELSPRGAPASWLWRMARIAQVRLRFVIVLLAAFLVVGQWGTLRTYWDALAHRWSGAAGMQHAVSDDTEYFCPMDPGVLSDWPGICSVCNMDLVRRRKGEATVLPEGVVARMQFSPYRVQLAGIQTSVVRRRPLTRDIDWGGRLIAVESTPRAAASATGGESPADTAGGRLEVTLDTDAVDRPWLTPGRAIELEIDVGPERFTLFGTIEPATDDAHADGATPRQRVRVSLPQLPAQVQPGQFAVARVRIPLFELEPFRSLAAEDESARSNGWPVLPESAVVHAGGRTLVYIESMPGMFDGVEVRLGPRCGDDYPVLSGVPEGVKVATIGAFLIDAEARLNPSLAAAYFGANRSAAASGAATDRPLADAGSATPLRRPRTQKSAAGTLSAADQALAARQKVCPVTNLALDSMGGPILIEVAGRRVFICCQGCEAPLKKDPEKYLSKLPAIQPGARE